MYYNLKSKQSQNVVSRIEFLVRNKARDLVRTKSGTACVEQFLRLLEYKRVFVYLATKSGNFIEKVNKFCLVGM